MIYTDRQRRWWFANHPDFSSDSETGKPDSHGKHHKSADKISPTEVDKYVDNALPYADGLLADFLHSVKRHFGTAGKKEPDDGSLGNSSEWTRVASNDDVVSDVPSQKDARAEKRDSDDRIQFEDLKPLFDAIYPGFGTFKNLNYRSILRRNMEEAGRPRPEGHDAHHIVPWADKRWPEAEKAREILKKFGIDINHEANGVWLPAKRGISTAQYHYGISYKEYYKVVAEKLEKATSRKEAIEKLRYIAEQLSKGPWP